MLPYLGYCKQCCNEHWGACIILDHASLLGICLRVRLQCHMVVLFLVFNETSILFSLVAVVIYIPTNREGGLYSLHSLSSFTVCECFDGNHSDWCEVLYCCSFYLHLSRKQKPTPASLPGKLHGQRSLLGYNPWDRKELDTTEHTIPPPQ